MLSTKMNYTILPRKFFIRGTHTVAKELLGKLLVRNLNNKTFIGRITEVESYIGEDDLACHASKGRTPRCEVMYGAAGHAYIYLIYGMYNCLNVVTEKENFPAAVLIRAVEPIQEIPYMKKLRKTDDIHNLTTGPGKLTQAFEITRELNTIDMTKSSEIFLANDNFHIPSENIFATTRVGVDYSGEHALLPWRYYIKNSKFISRP